MNNRYKEIRLSGERLNEPILMRWKSKAGMRELYGDLEFNKRVGDAEVWTFVQDNRSAMMSLLPDPVIIHTHEFDIKSAMRKISLWEHPHYKRILYIMLSLIFLYLVYQQFAMFMGVFFATNAYAMTAIVSATASGAIYAQMIKATTVTRALELENAYRCIENIGDGRFIVPVYFSATARNTAEQISDLIQMDKKLYAAVEALAAEFSTDNDVWKLRALELEQQAAEMDLSSTVRDDLVRGYSFRARRIQRKGQIIRTIVTMLIVTAMAALLYLGMGGAL